MMHYTYREELQSLKTKALGEVHFIVSSISKDLNNMNSLNYLQGDYIESLFKSYASYYEEQQVQLAFWKQGEVVYSNMPEIEHIEEYLSIESDTQYITIRELKDQKYIVIASTLSFRNETYIMIYGYSMASLEDSSRELLKMAIAVDIITIMLMAVILYGVLNRLTSPLRELSRLTDQMAKGDYREKVQIKGEDEFAELGNKFNLMSEKIEEQFKALVNENEKKQLLIDNLAHELRTPLTSISGYAEYMKVAPLDEGQRLEALNYIMGEAKRLEKLSHIVLSMADLRENELEMTKLDVNGLILKLKNLFEHQSAYQNVQLEFKTDIMQIEGNSVMLESLLINLIENSMRACGKQGKVEVFFSQDEEKKEVQIRISDNGIGMETDQLEKIAQPFYRIDKARSRKAGGVGLGVSLCYQIVKAHHGQITYFSKPGEGTQVIVQIPYEGAQAITLTKV